MEPETLSIRMEATLFAWWAALARSSAGASVVDLPGITAAVFPAPDMRDVLNNAVASSIAPPAAATVAALAALYRERNVARWQLWVREEDQRTAAIAGISLVVECSTLGMALDLQEARIQRPACLAVIESPDVNDVRPILDHADTLVPMLRAAGAAVFVLRCETEPACCVATFEHEGDCGIYTLETAGRFRRRGLARTLVLYALYQARERGCHTASLQATPMAESLYAALGFRRLWRYVEWQYRGDWL